MAHNFLITENKVEDVLFKCQVNIIRIRDMATNSDVDKQDPDVC